MKNERKTKAALISELESLRGRLAQLEKSRTEHKPFGKTARESDDRYRQLIENVLEGVWVIDTEAKLTFVNPRIAEIFGYTVEEMIGKSIFSLVDKKSASVLNRTLERRKRGVKEWYDFGFMRKDGTQVYTRVSGTPIFDDEGNYQGAIAIIADITDRKRAEDALRESEERYRVLSESLEDTVKKKVAELMQAQSLARIGQMVSAVAHEIRNPLQNIQTGIDTLRMEMGEDRQKLETMEWIDRSIGQLNGLVIDLLDYAKPVHLRYSSQPLRKVVDQALKAMADRLGNITVHLELEQEDEPIRVDVDKITRVLVNLITNASEAMSKGGSLTIRSQFYKVDGADFLNVSLSDTGCGIDAKILGQVQEPFFTTKRQGTGLGIPICKKIIDAHGGTFRMESQLNRGTTVEITLPL